MEQISFNVDANTARLIGRENVSKLEGAVLELVKNTYDADSDYCFIYYEKSSNRVIIGDNGFGMEKETIINHWMTIGRSSKNQEFITEKGRVQTGAKGIGRFALDRIGDKCKMYTKTSKSNSALLWEVDWSVFDFGKSITDVYANLNEYEGNVETFISEIKNKNIHEFINKYQSNSGTIFVIENLRDDWNEDCINNIRNILTTLLPYDLSKIFSINFFEEDTNVEESLIITNKDNSVYDYKISFDVDENGVGKILIHRNEFDFKDEFKEILKGANFTSEDEKLFKGKKKNIDVDLSDDGKYTIGAFSGVLYFSKNGISKRDQKKFYYKEIVKQQNKILNGIKLYRDNFKVRPYGDFGTSLYDWLQLSVRKNMSPAAITHTNGKWRVNSDQISGCVFISRKNETLYDQSNRESLVENEDFKKFKDFIIFSIHCFEEDRQYVFRKLNEFYTIRNAIVETEEKIRQAASIKSKDIKFEASVVQQVIDKKDEEIQFLEDENKILRTLATTGIITNTYIHEIKALTDQLGLQIATAKDLILDDCDKEDVLKRVDKAKDISNKFSSWFQVTIDSVKQDKRKMKKIALNECIAITTKSWSDVLQSKNINIVSELEEITYKCFANQIEIIIHNLIANSVTAFEKQRKPINNINIKLVGNDEYVEIQYCDDGPGLCKKYKQNPYLILEALESDKRDKNGDLIGTGMGMWIINKTVKEYNGTINLDKNKESTDGFYIDIRLK